MIFLSRRVELPLFAEAFFGLVIFINAPTAEAIIKRTTILDHEPERLAVMLPPVSVIAGALTVGVDCTAVIWAVAGL